MSDTLKQEKDILDVDDSGFTKTARGKAVRVSWDEIIKVVAYKHDLFAYDEICLGLHLSNNSSIGVSEEDVGFVAFSEALESKFPSIPRNWYNDVMFPAFERCFTKLYTRKL